VHATSDLQTPFYAKSTDTIIERVKSGSWDFSASCWEQVSEGALDLITQLLQVQAPCCLPLCAVGWCRMTWAYSHWRAATTSMLSTGWSPAASAPHVILLMS